MLLLTITVITYVAAAIVLNVVEERRTVAEAAARREAEARRTAPAPAPLTWTRPM